MLIPSGRTLVLVGERVALAEMVEEDQPLFHKWLSENAELRALIDDNRIPTKEDQRKWFDRTKQPGWKFFSLVTIEGDLIGHAGFVNIDENEKTAVMRITIGNPQFLGKGIGSEAVGLLSKFGFEAAGWDRLTLRVLETNLRAIRVYEKNGFRITGKESSDGKIKLNMSLSRIEYLKNIL